MIRPINDGLDHINIYSQGKTDLGRWLSNFANAPIEIPNKGEFQSIEGYWYWLGCKDDKLRELHGIEAKKYGQNKKRKEVKNFEEKIKKAILIKLKTYPDMRNKLKESYLPFEHYYVFKNKKVKGSAIWVIDFIEDIRRSLNKERNLRIVLDGHKSIDFDKAYEKVQQFLFWNELDPKEIEFVSTKRGTPGSVAVSMSLNKKSKCKRFSFNNRDYRTNMTKTILNKQIAYYGDMILLIWGKGMGRSSAIMNKMEELNKEVHEVYV